MKTFTYADGDDIVVPVPESWPIERVQMYLVYLHTYQLGPYKDARNETIFLGAATVRAMVALAEPAIIRRESAE